MIVLTLGVISSLGFEPTGNVLILIVAHALFLTVLQDERELAGAFRMGLLFGTGQFMISFGWLTGSLHVHGGLNLPITFSMLLALSAMMALYVGLFALGAVWMARRNGSMDWRVLLLFAPVWWAACELLREMVLTGFPWNFLGYIWADWDTVRQMADLGGVWLLSAWTVALSATLALLLKSFSIHGQWSWRTALTPLLTITVLVVFATGYGALRLDQADDHADLAGGEASPWLRIAMVQGNIPQALKWKRKQRDRFFNRYVTMTRQLLETNRKQGERSIDLVIWPETAMAFFIQRMPLYRDVIQQLIDETGVPILTGVPTTSPYLHQDGSRGRHYYNSVVLFPNDGSKPQRYNKHHLVPFGEFIPFRNLVPETFRKFTHGTRDFSSGEGAVPLLWSRASLGILICYEAVFPHEVRQLVEEGAELLVNVTNDAWFGASAKPQHLAMTRMRAVENRVPLVRAANTGITAAYDDRGRELGQVGPDRQDHLVIDLRPGTGDGFFRFIGTLWIPVFLLFSVGLVLRKRVRSQT
ncbi:MAG: apolipoprotein N-acyltransferase [Magnetococcales bacterium]|nr:apolipoprotein N-acyltransferase [Magnetococcales bacterium]